METKKLNFLLKITFLTTCAIGMLFSQNFKMSDVYATDTVFTEKASGTMGWHATPYGSGFTEAKMKANVDWMAANFKQYGYEYIAVDGWVDATLTHNADGYITKYHDDWVNDWGYWANYVHSKGLKLGMYYNPAWVQTAIADDTNNKIKGTNIPIKNITDPAHMHQTRYLIDPGKPGAEQYVKGMIEYYKSVGVDLIKIDFIREIDDAYGATATETYYRWMREAAGNDMLLYFANQKNRNHAAAESQYADLIRASEDWRQDVWYHTSARNRGQVQDGKWPPAYNIFDGFVFLSDVSGKGKVVLDGDFSILNTSTSDAEKKFRIGLLAMAGSSINIGDNYSNIGSNDVYYKNLEMIDLNKMGFVGKPLTRTLTDPRSQIWKGRLPNGDWVVGLFNREDTTQTRSVNFQNELGLSGSYPVRDLWQHAGVGTLSSYSANIEPHGSRIIRIASGASKTVKQETEVLMESTSGSGAALQTDTAASGGRTVKLNAIKAGDWIEFTVFAPAAGTYNVKVGYKDNPSRGQFQTSINGAKLGGVIDQYANPGNVYKEANLGNVTLSAAGIQKVRFTVTGKNAASTGYSILFDYISLTP